MTARLILASGSPRRYDLLLSAHLKPALVISPDINEDPKKGELPLEYSKRIALDKMNAVVASYPNDCIITADTIVSMGRRIILKPENADDARAMLSKLSGRRHRVISSVCVYFSGKIILRTVTTAVSFKRISASELDMMIESGEWEGKCGAYMIQGIAGSWVKFIGGSFSNIVGLPIYETCQILKGLSCYKDLIYTEPTIYR